MSKADAGESAPEGVSRSTKKGHASSPAPKAADKNAAASLKSDEIHDNDLLSERFDCADGVPRRMQYLVFAPRRTGSELLCAHLQRHGLGIPFEYLNSRFAAKFAARVGARSANDAILASRYYRAVVDKRTKNGVFGLKVQYEHILDFVERSPQAAKNWVERFDRIILMRRRDKVLQAVSHARAVLTQQWHVYGDSKGERVVATEEVLFSEIASALKRIIDDEAVMSQLTADVEASRMKFLTYEDLSDSVIGATADWLWKAAGGRPAEATIDKEFELPRRQDQRETRAIKERFLSRIGIW